jgi:hypothetical protein
MRKLPLCVLHPLVYETVAESSLQSSRRRSAAARHRAAPVSGVVAAARRTHASRTVRSVMDGPGRVPLRFKWPVHRGPMDRAHGSVHGILSRWI